MNALRKVEVVFVFVVCSTGWSLLSPLCSLELSLSFLNSLPALLSLELSLFLILSLLSLLSIESTLRLQRPTSLLYVSS